MSLFLPGNRETISFGDTTFDLYELSGYERCEYLAKTIGHLGVTEEGGITEDGHYQDRPTVGRAVPGAK